MKEIIVFEVISDAIDRRCWRQYRESLEGIFEQDEIVVRAMVMEKALARHGT